MNRNPGSVNSRSRKKVTRLLRKWKSKQNYLNNWLMNLDQRDFSVIRERRKKINIDAMVSGKLGTR